MERSVYSRSEAEQGGYSDLVRKGGSGNDMGVGSSTHGILAAEVEEVVELVELSRDHEEEEPHQKNDRHSGLCVRRANIAIPDSAAQSGTAKKEFGNTPQNHGKSEKSNRESRAPEPCCRVTRGNKTGHRESGQSFGFTNLRGL